MQKKKLLHRCYHLTPPSPHGLSLRRKYFQLNAAWLIKENYGGSKRPRFQARAQTQKNIANRTTSKVKDGGGMRILLHFEQVSSATSRMGKALRTSTDKVKLWPNNVRLNRAAGD